MPNTESVSHGDLVVCAAGQQEYTARDAIEAGLFRGDLNQPWKLFLRRVAAQARADEQDMDLDEEAFDAAAEAFRYKHDLITAEETERWLTSNGLTLDDFSDYFARQCWGGVVMENLTPAEIDYSSAPADLRDLFAIDLILSGQLQDLTTQLSWRLAAVAASGDVEPDAVAMQRKEFLERAGMKAAALKTWLEAVGRDEAWLDRQAALEGAYRRRAGEALGPNAHQKELASMRLGLTRFETEWIEVESRDAAQEALLCVTEDGMSMEEVATEGRYPHRRLEFVFEDLAPDAQQKFLSVSSGQVLAPMPRGDGFELCRVINKVEPQAGDPGIRGRIEQRLLDRHFAELASKHVERRLGNAVVAE